MLRFPDDAENSETYFFMVPYKFTVSPSLNSATNSQNVRRDFNLSSRIVLPTPSSGISLNESGNWEETQGFQQFAQGTKANVLNKIKENFGNLAEHAFKGQFINDYASLSYKGSNFRTFNFAWDLIPSSESEANEISSIIQTIRRNALPNYSSELLSYPSMWKVYPIANNPMGLALQDCVISNFTCNYTPEGVLRTFTSGHPTSVNVEIEFKELYRANRFDVIDISGDDE